MAAKIIRPLNSDIMISALVFLLSVALSAYLFGAFVAQQPLREALASSRWYHQLGQALWSGGELPVRHPPIPGYSYPLLATGLASVSPALLILLQTGAVSGGVFCLLRTERNLTGHILFAPLALLSVSLLLSPGFLMAEAFGFGLAAAAILAFTSTNKATWGVLLLIAASLIKPAFQPVALLSVVMVLRLNRSSLIVWIIAAALILPQLMFSQVLTGRAHFTEAGRANFQQRFYPAVVGMAEAGKFVPYKDELALAARTERPQTDQQIRYVRQHLRAAASAWATILWQHHLFTTSGFTNRDNTFADKGARITLKAISGAMALVFTALLIPSALGVVALLGRWPFQVWPAALVGLSIFAAAPLVYWQGDRIVFIGFLLMLPFAGLGVRWVADLARFALARASRI